MKTVIILYELEQLASLDALMARGGKKGEAPRIVSLDAEIDFALEKRGTPFISGKTLQNRETPAAYVRADEITQALYDDKRMSFLKYRNVSLLDPLRFSTQVYLGRLFHYIDVIERFAESVPEAECFLVPVRVVPVSKTSDPLAVEESKIIYEAARLVAGQRNIHCELYNVRSAALKTKDHWQAWVFAWKRSFFGAVLSLLNACMALRPRRPIRILASDYWRSLAPILQELPDAEIILLDRSQALFAGFKNIWRHKMRFMHIEQFLSRKEKWAALAHAKQCKEEWLRKREEFLSSLDLSFRNTDLTSTANRILTHLIDAAVPDIVSDIEGAYSLYAHLAPDSVLLRASASRQRHFSVLPLVAQELGIPALEIQHGGEYLGAGSGTRRHAAQFLATYGPLVCEEFQTLGYGKERLFPVGSPRFDAYVRGAQKSNEEKEKSGVTILSNTPTMDISERYGTYSIEEYFKTLGEAARNIPDARLLVATRSTSVRGAFQEEARTRGLAGVNYESVGTTPLPELFRQADIFVCSYSTVVYEALLHRLPVILAAFAPTEKMMADFHFGHFEKVGALRIAHSPEELSAMLQKLSADREARIHMGEKAGWEFMQRKFSFDGRAAERIADLIRDWSE